MTAKKTHAGHTKRKPWLL